MPRVKVVPSAFSRILLGSYKSLSIVIESSEEEPKGFADAMGLTHVDVRTAAFAESSIENLLYKGPG